MADVNANIGVNIDTSDALNQLKNLQRQISQFHQSVAKSSSSAAIAQRDLQKNFVNGVNAIQGFSAELRTVRTSAESFTNSLEKNKFSIQQYFRYAASQSKTFGKNFTAEFAAIEKTAIERVKTLQTQYVKMGRDANGAMQAIAIRPTVLDMKNLGTQTAITAQKQVLFNQLVKQGSTNLLNFGKNTQWAGRQLMVGFTLPLVTLGITAGRVFMDMEQAALKFKKVYGDLFTAPEETDKALDSIMELGLAYTKYGVAVSESLEVAADAAAAGFAGVDLQNQTSAALKLSVLGQLDLQKALETTIALQNAFNISSKDLAEEIDFLNAVENQTVVALEDITEAVPRVAPVIQSLGGDVRDLAFFLAAMKEGGVNAAQGANALKSGLASLINPTTAATQFLGQLNIDIQGIVARNKGDISATVVELAKALDNLDPQRRAQAIEQLFGKFQFARMSALFDNVIKDGSQAGRVLDLAGSSASDLADLANKELGVSAASAMNKFRASVEQLKVALAPLGELFLDIATPFIEFATGMLKAFNSLPDGIKKVIGTVITVVGGIGPVLLMTFGLINNGIANMIKFFATVRLGYLKMTGQAKGIGDETEYMTQEQLEAAAAAASLDQAHAGLTQRFTAEKAAVDALRVAYQQAADAGARFATLNPGMMRPGSVAAPTKMARGGVVSVGGRGNKDTEPALLTPGEAVIPAPMVKKYAPLIQGMIAGNIPGYAKGVMLGMPKSSKSVSKGREASEEVYEMFLKSSYANTPPTEYGHQLSKTTGHSFPIFGLGGVYQKGNKQVFVKPVLNETAALAEMRSTEITRKAHGLEAPEQRIVVIRDPMDTTRTRKFLALESDLDPKFVNNQPMGLFNEEQYFRQLVASLLRVDKDLSGSNVFGNVVADAGPSGVFNRASGLREYEKNLPSMEDQALINLLGIKGGAKRAFAESTLGMMAGLTPEQYRQRMLGEIQRVLPRLKETIASFGLTNPTEVGVYDDMIRRLEEGLGVDWSKFHAVHSAVKPAKPKAPTQVIPGYKNGVVSVPGPKGAGDVTPAMLSPGEAVIPTAMAKKYAPLIQGMIAGNIPGYAEGLINKTFGRGGPGYVQGSHLDIADPKNLLTLIREIAKLGPEYAQQIITLRKLKTDGTGAFEEITISLEELIRRVDDVNNKEYDENTQLQVHGAMYGGTAMLEPEARNQAYRVAGYGGVPTTPEGLLRASELAEQALLSDSRDAQMNAAELQALVDARKIALEALISSDKSLDHTLGILAEAYSQGIQASRLETDVAKANARAAERMAQIREEYLVDLQEGMSSEEALTRAKAKAADALLMEASVQSPAGGPTLYSFEEGQRSKITPLSTGRKGGTGGAGRDARDVALDIYQHTASQIGDRTGEFAVETAKESFRSYDAALDINSPSGKFKEVAQQVAAGVDEAKPQAQQAGKEIGKTITQEAQLETVRVGPRRVSTDTSLSPYVPPTQAGADSANIAAGAPRAPRRVIREGDMETRLSNQAETNENLEGTNKSFIELSNKASKFALGLSAVTGILSMFGGDMAGISSAVSMVSGAIFALISVTNALQGTFIAAAIAKRAETVATAMNAGTNAAGAASLGSLFVKGKGLAGLFANLGTALKVGLRFLGPIGIALSVLAIAIPFVIKAFEDHADKINGLGAAANLTEEKLTFLAEKFNVTAKSINWADRAAAMGASSGKSSEEQKQVVDLMVDTDFATEFKTEIAGIKNATKQEAELALQSLAMQLRNSGFEEDAVSAIISAIAAKAEQTDLDLNFKPVFITDESTANQAAGLAKEAIDAFNKEVSDRQAVIDVSNQARTTDSATYNDTPETLSKSSVEQETKAAAGVAKSSIDSLTLAFESGNISADIYNQSLSDLFNSINSAERPDWMIQSLAEQMGLKDVVQGLTDAADKSLALQAAIAGIDAGEDLEVIREASKAENQDDTELQAKALTARKNITEAIEEQTKAQEGYNNEKTLSNILEQDSIEGESVQASITAYHDLVAAGMDAELAYQLTGDAAQVAAFKAAQATDAINGNTAAVDAFKLSAESLDALNKEREALNPKGSGGGQKSAFQEAIDQLKEQQKAAKDSITTYAGLRSSGLGVAEAFEIAGDSMLSAALASQKVGSAGWNQLITAIRAARAEEAAWLNSTPEGRAEHFADVYGKVMDVFSAQEAILEMNNESATAANRKIIETLEKQIEAYERRASELQRDLDKIAEKEDEINKAYDEKTKALETVKKLNQDIINQQKSQLSIADALSKGDISAAASAMQDARAQGASTQGDAMGRALDAARESELNGLTQNGKTRKQIETEIEKIKKNISAIEFGALQTARDAVKAADEALETAKENLKVQGQSRDEWENINTRIDASKANAALYDAEVVKALENAKGLVGEWSKLEDTFTTTHVINTVTTTNGVATTNNNPNPSSTLTKAQWITKLQSEITELKRDFTRAEAAGRPSGGIATQIRNKESDLARIKASPEFAAGGYISGPGTGTSDSIPAMLSDGEYVIKAASVNKFGQGFLDAINAGRLPGFKMGGMIIPDKGKSSKATPPKTPINIRAIERAATAKPIGRSAQALVDFIKNPKTAYSANLNKASLEAFVNKNTIPAGQEMYRTLTPGELARIKTATAAGLDYKPSQVRSFAGSSDLQTLGNSMSSKGNTRFGGANDMARTIAQITAMENLKGIQSVNRFGMLSQLNQEGILGPDTRYKLLSSTPATATTPGVMRFAAFLRSLGPIGYLPDILEMGNVFSGNSSLLNKPQFQFAKGGLATNKFAMGGLVSPKYFAMGGLVSPKYFANGGMAKGTDTVPSMLTPGEFVTNKASTKRFAPLLEAINSGNYRYSTPSMSMVSKNIAQPVYNIPEKAYAPTGGAMPLNGQLNNASSLTALDNSVYNNNYSLSVNVGGTDVSANEIANVVINKIKAIDSQQVRRQVLR